jgi:hypothetical protein
MIFVVKPEIGLSKFRFVLHRMYIITPLILSPDTSSEARTVQGAFWVPEVPSSDLGWATDHSVIFRGIFSYSQKICIWVVC